MLYDRLATRAEEAGRLQKSQAPADEFVAWADTLTYPPTRDLTNRAACEEAMGQWYLRVFTETYDRHMSGVTAVPDDEQAPPGWDNATLLADMERSWRTGG